MARQKPCRFSTAEIGRMLKVMPKTERRVIKKLKHYMESSIEVLHAEDALQRSAEKLRKSKEFNLTAS